MYGVSTKERTIEKQVLARYTTDRYSLFLFKRKYKCVIKSVYFRHKVMIKKMDIPLNVRCPSKSVYGIAGKNLS